MSEFVSLGIIEASDILLVHPCPEGGGQFDLEVQAAGIPDEHLVVFAGAPVSPAQVVTDPVPAISPLGVVLLAALLLGAGAAALRNRARSEED